MDKDAIELADKIYQNLSNPVTEENLAQAIEDGLIPKEELIHGQEYFGVCRNARIAVWDANIDSFIYKRAKFGYLFCEPIKHPSDDHGFDIFVPTAVNPEPSIANSEEYKSYYERCISCARRSKGLKAFADELNINESGAFNRVCDLMFDGDYKKLNEVLDNIELEESEIPVPLWNCTK